MIGKITGRVDYVAEDHVLIEAGGIGYIVHCAPPTLAALPGPGEVAALYTELVVREDLMQLIGFRTVGEREWHRLLTSVQGVGARLSLAILGALGPDGVSRALALGDSGAIRGAPGVGPKLAQRIVNELADKAPGVMALGAQGRRAAAARGPVASGEALAPVALPEAGEATADALSALVNLGYDRMEAARAVAEAGDAGAGGPAALIKAALKTLGRNL
ncbi:MAG TPA: Holliday junction branch migration protein RuvA [Thermohalobaculum sp.]|nr:Holliday junction branch migration protein RuvA [Thermohalobaculum sp.]